MQLQEALAIATEIKDLLSPHCYRCEIAGSILREKADVKDIEIVCIPKRYESKGMFADGIASIVNEWKKVKGELEYGKCKYTQRILPQGIKLDLFMCKPENWGIIYVIRTGPLEFNIGTLIPQLEKQGYIIDKGFVHYGESIINTPEEEDVFKLMNVPYIKPQDRK